MWWHSVRCDELLASLRAKSIPVMRSWITEMENMRVSALVIFLEDACAVIGSNLDNDQSICRLLSACKHRLSQWNMCVKAITKMSRFGQRSARKENTVLCWIQTGNEGVHSLSKKWLEGERLQGLEHGVSGLLSRLDPDSHFRVCYVEPFGVVPFDLRGREERFIFFHLVN